MNLSLRKKFQFCLFGTKQNKTTATKNSITFFCIKKESGTNLEFGPSSWFDQDILFECEQKLFTHKVKKYQIKTLCCL